MRGQFSTRSIQVLVVFIWALVCANLSAADGKTALKPDREFAIVGYLPHYQVGHINRIDFSKLTDVVYFASQPNPNGDLNTSDANLEELQQLRKRAEAHKVGVHLGVGGWSRSSGFAQISADTKLRTRFIKQLVAFCQTHRLQGIDLDWEYPEGAEQVKQYSQLLVETKAAFKPHGLKLSVAIPGWATHISSEAYAAIDRLHVMAYDREGDHSTFEKSVLDMKFWLDRDFPREKLTMGIPFYGRNASRESVTYVHLRKKFNPASDVDTVGGFYFNNLDTVQRKTRHARDEGFAGVFIWELSQDSYQKDSLLKAIHDAAVK